MGFEHLIKQNQKLMVQAIRDIVKVKSMQGPSKPGMPFGDGPLKQKNYDIRIEKQGDIIKSMKI